MMMGEEEMKEREELMKLMRECVEDARVIVQERRLLENQTVLSNIAVALFEARLRAKKK
jgi:ABC-type nitrate/sulfonate/bicarbonate transport system ATPase subunit